MRDPDSQPPTVTLIGYGSLMSGFGLASFGSLPATAATAVRLHNGRRGFGKASRFGDRYAMALDLIHADAPLTAATLTSSSAAGIDALALAISLETLARVAVREGYRAEVVRLLCGRAEQRGVGLAELLWQLLTAADFDVAVYRRHLFDLAGYTSAHYVPHPVPLDQTGMALTFLAPGAEGSGCDMVVPIRVATGVTRLLTAAEALHLKPNESQIDYLVMCALAEVHGISVADVLADLDADFPLASRVRARLAEERPAEAERFASIVGLPRNWRGGRIDAVTPTSAGSTSSATAAASTASYSQH